MGISVVERATAEPVSLDMAKSHCRVTNTEEDGLIAGYILAARIFAEGLTRRVLATQTIDCSFDSWRGWPSRGHPGYHWGDYSGAQTRLEFPVSPVQSVVWVKYTDMTGNVQTLPPEQYLSRLDESVAYIEPVYGQLWPVVRPGSASIIARVIAGWPESSLPEDLRQALLLLVAHFYDNRIPVHASNANATEIPFTVEAILSGYRISRIIS